MSEQREPVGIVRTVGGYPDDSTHTVEWLVKHKDLHDGDKLYASPQTRNPEPELEFWPGDVLICKEDGTKVTVANGNRGSLQLMNGKIAVAWDDNVFGEYTIAQIKEMFYQDEKPELELEPVAWYDKHGMITHDCFEGVTPLYTAPPTRKPLTDEDLDALRQGEDKLNFVTLREFRVIARAIERAHGITND